MYWKQALEPSGNRTGVTGPGVDARDGWRDIISSMSRVWIVRIWCVLFALLNASGAHAHRLASEHEAGARDVTLHDSVRHSDTHAHDLSNANHEHLHAAHGAVDVDAPAKAFGKSPVKTDLFVLALAGILSVLLLRRSQHLRLAPSSRPSLRRWLFWYLPPTHAPPRTA
jgi:hypothetical protein